MASLEMREALERVFNHLVLPPQLPSGQDEGLDKIGHDILRRIRRACGQLTVVTNKRFENAWKTVNAGIAMFQKTDENSRPVPTLLEAFKRLENEGNVVALYIEEQNTGLLMYRHTGNDEASHIVFEAFEASPLSSDVLSAPDALRWTFPSRAAQIPVNDFNATNFQSTLAAFLDQARSEYISHLADKASKAGRDIAEVRNAANPDLITHMLLSLIQGIGRTAVVEPIKKRVRDDVSFGDGEKPWRRLPAWLILRVFMQRQMSLLLGSSLGYTAYKILSCMILSQLLDDCVKFRLLPDSVSLLQKKLGRKLAKLEGHLSSDNTATPDQTHSEILNGTALIFKASIEQANRYLEAEILRFKTGNLLNILQLPDFQSMKRLRRIQKYLNKRRNSSTLGAMTIFSEGDMSFNSRFSNSSPTHCALQEKILHKQNRLREAKTDEWKRNCPMLPQRGSAKWPYTPTHSETLGTVHAFFKDESFVCRLLNEIEKRLAGIEKNWRETSTMEALITLILRAIELNAQLWLG
ncbi:hypothetical protein SEUCBS140593_003022 [Sporothrix eucalyptigena]|uniref:DUF6606 domain-containing protein n=1 Tax=Sporothrix eucalyptigena TaxID=1812306 RepID=A0ABP0BBP2_9PEZI